MTEQMHCRLKPVRARQRWRLALWAAAIGLLAGSCLGILLAGVRLLGAGLPLLAVIGMPAAGLALGLAAGLLWRRSWKDAAVAVDLHYRLKDRAATALAFLGEPEPTVMHRLQIVDAIDHLGRIEAREVVPLEMPRPLPYAVAALSLAVLLVLIPLGMHRAEAEIPARLPEIVAEAEDLEETMIEDLEELAQEHPEEPLEEVVLELKELVEQMKEPGVDQRDALAKLSEMQAAIAEALAEYNLEAVDAGLEALAEAIAPAEALKAASRALQDGKYEKAAEELQQFDPSKITRKEAKTVAPRLGKLAEDMQDAGQGQLSDATSELCEGLECRDAGKCQGGACKLAGLCRTHGLRKAIGMCLAAQLSRLAECKGNCCGGSGNGRGNKSGGSNVAKSKSPTNTWGRGATGQPLGDNPTSLDADRLMQRVSGTPGEGPSDREVSHAPEGRQQATRSYREMYHQYRKMSEAVLESEPLPLGHRQTIRRYFELIHPQNADVADPPAPEGSEQ